MADSQKMFIGIKKLWYGDVITTAPLTPASVKSFIGSATVVPNVHDDTWGYEQSDPESTDYINQLTGEVYYRDKVVLKGSSTISFTLGTYSFQQKADLQGGVADDSHWESSPEMNFITKTIVAQTKTGQYIVFPFANIVAKGNYVERNVGLGVQATAMETGIAGIASEYFFEESAIASASPAQEGKTPAKPAEAAHGK
ncbi:hypothetical protein Barb6XT_01840 [Bacteroidales bacterium Barb6XT]|nr:hypothetical protein Barb6XT_01840 [Bacteroidales bacterium Barb6XT]